MFQLSQLRRSEPRRNPMSRQPQPGDDRHNARASRRLSDMASGTSNGEVGKALDPAFSHELAHVVQGHLAFATSAGLAASHDPGGRVESYAEQDAERVADSVISAPNRVSPSVAIQPGTMQRQPDDAPVAMPRPIFLPPRLLDADLERPEILAGQPPELEPLQLTFFRDEPVVEDAVATLLHAVDSFSGTPQTAVVWPHVVKQVRDPRPEQRRGAPAELYRPDVVRALTALMPSVEEMTKRTGGHRPGRGDKSAAEIATDRKQIVLERVFSKLLAAADRRLEAAAGDPEAAAGDPEAEWHRIPAVQKYLGMHLDGYLANRAALLAAFGALEAGTTTALARANAYYRDKIVAATFLGKKALVHQDMRAALERATMLLTDPERAALAREITSLGSTEIRPNTNNPLELSRHSFGAAIDINPALNPNVRNFPTRFIEDVTGADLLHTITGQPKADVFDLGAMVKDLLFGRKDPALREIEHLLAVSNQLAGIFRDDASLAAGMVAVQNRLTGPQSPIAPATLLMAVRAARDEGPHVRWRYQDPKVKLSPKSPVGIKHEGLAEMLFPGAIGPETLDQLSRKQRIIALLIQMADVYQRSFAPVGHKAGAPGGGGQRRITPEIIPPSGEGALPQLVAHGFVNLPSRVISALRAPEGGDLRWLGVGEHVHDFMHFELKQPPKLY